MHRAIPPKVPTVFWNPGSRPPPFQAHQPLKMASICTNNTLKFLRFDEVVFLCYGQFYGLLLQNLPILLPYFRPHSLRIHYAGRKRPLGRGALRAQIHPGYGTGVPANPHEQRKIPRPFSRGIWSEWRESNSRPLEPHSSALPNCATPGHCRQGGRQIILYPPRGVLSTVFFHCRATFFLGRKQATD